MRKRMRGTSDRPRLSVTRTLHHIYCQVIDDSVGKTLVSASTADRSLREGVKSTSNKGAAVVVGKAIADRAKALGINQVCFDRGSYKYHGRVAALADAARESGLKL